MTHYWTYFRNTNYAEGRRGKVKPSRQWRQTIKDWPRATTNTGKMGDRVLCHREGSRVNSLLEERLGERQTETETETDRQKDRQRQRQTGKQTDRQRQRKLAGERELTEIYHPYREMSAKKDFKQQ